MNDQEHPYRIKIHPLAQRKERPLWSVMIPTYNCATYLRKTLTSVLAQDPGEHLMQIEVIDDHSTTDDPAAVVAELAHDRVKFYRQPVNVGVPKNFDTCLERSQGQLIHILHGDDYVLDGFYNKLHLGFLHNTKLGAAFCRQIFIDEKGNQLGVSELEQHNNGVLDNYLERLASEQKIMTPSIVVKRDVYETLGGFDQRLICSEDWEMWVRIAAHYPVWYEPEPLAAYRMHTDSNTGRHIRTGEDMRYTRKAISIFKSYLPHKIANNVCKKARVSYAHSAINMAKILVEKRDLPAALIQIKEALSFSLSPAIVKQAFKLIKKALVNQN